VLLAGLNLKANMQLAVGFHTCILIGSWCWILTFDWLTELI